MKQTLMPMLFRFLVYRSRESKNYLCVCAGRDRRHALKIARQLFELPKTAFAVPETPNTLHLWA